MTQIALAHLIGRSERWMIDVEKDTVDLRLSDVSELARALKVEVAQLTGSQFEIPSGRQPSANPNGATASANSGNLLVDQEHAELLYRDHTYRARMRRLLVNIGTVPITRFLVRVSVDRYPADPDRSNLLYRSNPLEWSKLSLTADCDGEPMDWSVKIDHDAIKEAYLLFQTPSGRKFPLYPQQSAWIEYSYEVSDEQWGTWFQRAIRWPTRHLSVRLVFPRTLDPFVWGTETSVTTDASPFSTPIVRQEQDDRVVFEWSTENPALDTRYRLEREFHNPLAEPTDSREVEDMGTVSQLQLMGIRQVGDPILTRSSQDFDLPSEAEQAHRVGNQLVSLLDKLATVHVFRKGMGIAAPQIGTPRSAAVIKPPEGEAPFLLFNPRVVEQSESTDEQYEGCLSFFDVRGAVPRPTSIEVEHTLLDGSKRITQFDHGLARLVLHEIDHLQGRLYTDRMQADATPIPVSQYRGTGKAWEYEPGSASHGR